MTSHPTHEKVSMSWELLENWLSNLSLWKLRKQGDFLLTSVVHGTRTDRSKYWEIDLTESIFDKVCSRSSLNTGSPVCHAILSPVPYEIQTRFRKWKPVISGSISIPCPKTLLPHYQSKYNRRGSYTHKFHSSQFIDLFKRTTLPLICAQANTEVITPAHFAFRVNNVESDRPVEWKGSLSSQSPLNQATWKSADRGGKTQRIAWKAELAEWGKRY
jgi:hypothetical protein